MVFDTSEEPYARLCQFLERKSVPDVSEALLELQYQAILSPFRELVNAGMFTWLIQNRWNDRGRKADHTARALVEIESKLVDFYTASASWLNENTVSPGQEIAPEVVKSTAVEVAQEIGWILSLPSLSEKIPAARSRLLRQALTTIQEGPGGKSELLKGSPLVWSVLLAFSIIRGLGQLEGESEASERSQAYLGQWLLDKQIGRTVFQQGLDDWTTQRSTRLVRLLLDWQSWYTPGEPASEMAARFLQDTVRDLDTQRFLNVNLYNSKLWFNKENYDEMTWWILALAAIAARKIPVKELPAFLGEAYVVIELLQEAEAQSGYQLDRLTLPV